MSDLDRQHWCPVCNSQVHVISTGEGTMHYQPVSVAEIRTAADRLLQVEGGGTQRYQSITREQALQISKQTLLNAENDRKMAVMPILPGERAIMDEMAEVEQLRVTLEAAQYALIETMGELRQVCEILGGPEFTESAIDLATKAVAALATEAKRAEQLAGECERLRARLDHLIWHPAGNTVEGYQRWCRICLGVESAGHSDSCAARGVSDVE